MKPGVPKRILMTADAVGGVWQYAIELCRALHRFGVQIILTTMGATLTPAQRDEAASLSNAEIYESSYKLEWMDSPWRDVASAGEWLLEMERQFRPDIIHLNAYGHASLPWSAPKIVVGHSCVLSWWRAVKGTDAPSEWNAYRRAVRRGLQSADLVVAPSQAMLSELRGCYGYAGNARVIWNGRAPSEGNAHQKEKIILAAGRLWDEAKNVALLRDTAPLLRWPVFLAGDETNPCESQSQPGRFDTEFYAKKREARYLGRLERADLARWLNRAAIYALPAKYEPFGLSILEAALARCALVLGDIQSLREIWGDAAVYVPPNDGAALRESLNELSADDVKREELGQKALHRAMYFTPERMADNYLAAYRELHRGSVQHEKQEAMCAL